MEIFDVFSMNGIENNPASGEFFLENVILKVSQTHFSRISIPRGGGPMPPLGLAKGGGGHKFFKGGGAMPPPRGGREVPCARASHSHNLAIFHPILTNEYTQMTISSRRIE